MSKTIYNEVKNRTPLWQEILSLIG